MDYRKHHLKTTVGLSQHTKETLKSMKKVGQSYDGLLRELIDFWDNKQREYWTRRKANKSKPKHN